MNLKTEEEGRDLNEAWEEDLLGDCWFGDGGERPRRHAAGHPEEPKAPAGTVCCQPPAWARSRLFPRASMKECCPADPRFQPCETLSREPSHPVLDSRATEL